MHALPVAPDALPATDTPMQACTYRPDPFKSAKSLLFDTSNWRPFCDATLTLKQARQSDNGVWIKIDDYPCRQAFRHFVDTANVLGYSRYLKKVKYAPLHYGHGNEVTLVAGIFTVQLNCLRTQMVWPLRSSSAAAGRR